MANKYVDITQGFFSAAEEPQDINEIEEIELYDIKDETVQAQIVSEVLEEYTRRKSENQLWHLQWIKNLAFISGNQYCDVFPELNDVLQTEKVFAHQQRKVYNMIAPIHETRLAQLNFVDYTMKAKPNTNDQDDIIEASLNTKILKLDCRNQNLPALMRRAQGWSEACGTAFLMPTWNPRLGKKLGYIEDLDGKNRRAMFQGDKETMVCSPFEILPDSPYCETVEDNISILRHKVYKSQEVFNIWGVHVEGTQNTVLTMQFRTAITPSPWHDSGAITYSREQVGDSVVVYELWERPTLQYPDGRLIIVAGEKLLYYGALPYQNKRDGQRGIPLIPVKSIDVQGCFWGKSVVERMIPIQEQYNAVKNRKMELLNMATNQVLAVEMGSVDVDELAENGVGPGSILEYRRGFNPPRWLEMAKIPPELIQEEQDLINLFVLVSGVSEMAWRSQIPANATSGPMLQIVQELDQTRLSISAKNSRNAVLEWGAQNMAISKQCVAITRIQAIAGDTDSYETISWNQEAIQYYDIEFETENELSQTPAQRYQMSMDFAKMGLFINPKTGLLDELARSQLLSTLKIGNWENISQRTDQQIGKARRNIELIKKGRLAEIQISSIDDNEIFMDEYAGFMLSDQYRKMVENNPLIGEFMEDQIQQHKDEIQRKAKENMMNQMSLQLEGQQMQAMAQMNLNNNVQSLAASQNAAMQNKNAAQTASNIQTVPQPNQAENLQSASQPEVEPAAKMAELLASVQ